MIGLKREGLAGPAGEQLDQIAVVQQLLAAQCHYLRDTHSGTARSQHGADICNGECARDCDRHHFASPTELPGEWPAALRVAILDAFVRRQFDRVLRPAVPLAKPP